MIFRSAHIASSQGNHWYRSVQSSCDISTSDGGPLVREGEGPYARMRVSGTYFWENATRLAGRVSPRATIFITNRSAVRGWQSNTSCVSMFPAPMATELVSRSRVPVASVSSVFVRLHGPSIPGSSFALNDHKPDVPDHRSSQPDRLPSTVSWFLGEARVLRCQNVPWTPSNRNSRQW